MHRLSDLLQDESGVYRMIIVIGCYHSGKTSFIASLTGLTSEIVDISGYTGYPSEDMVTRMSLADNRYLLLLEWRGARMMHDLQEKLGKALVGVVVMVDDNRAETFAETRTIFREIRATPVIITANAHDTDEAWSMEDLRIALRLSDDDRLMTCDVSQRMSTAAVVLKLTETLPETDFIITLKKVLQGIN